MLANCNVNRDIANSKVFENGICVQNVDLNYVSFQSQTGKICKIYKAT
jgi:hypothetical protein